MRLKGKKRRGPVQRPLVRVRTFLSGKQGNKGLTAALQLEKLLGQMTLIKFV